MLAHFQHDLGLLHWESLAAPMVGLASAGLMLLMALSLLRHRRPALPARAGQENTPERDPFEYGSTKERRSSVRRGGKLTQVLISNADATAEPFAGLVCNRSLGGLRLSVPQAVEANVILSIRPVAADAGSPWVQVEVRWCRAREKGCWELGCHFVRTPPYSQLLLFG